MTRTSAEMIWKTIIIMCRTFYEFAGAVCNHNEQLCPIFRRPLFVQINKVFVVDVRTNIGKRMG